MNATGEASHRLDGRAFDPSFRWRGWALSALVVLLLLLVFEASHRVLEARSQASLYRVIVAGESLTLDAETHAAFSRDLTRLAAEAEATLAARMAPWSQARLEQAFALLEAAVPGYLDWYFSLRGSYLRLAMGIAGDQAAWLEAQRHERLIEASGIEPALADLQVDHAARLADEQRAVVEAMSARLLERYAPRRVADAKTQAAPAFDLDSEMQETLPAALDTRRWRSAALGGSGLGLLAGRPLARRLAASAAGQSGRIALRALAARLGAGAARSFASGGTAAAVSAPTGPGALMVGAATTAVGLAGLVGGEFALLKLQETRHRPAFEARLRDGIDEARRDVARSLEGATSAAAARLAEGLESRSEEGKRMPSQARPDHYRILGQLKRPAGSDA
ncbi:hypothetical protein [Halomonas saccharevitans]|uniref:Uncharacterized protein n=1 Tax=Halomonas saccharevitans TaxID=416872 RepID=A0A1I7BBD5_9GAMM|nr:hypothetical protein [Halomonas saccharevitans]SFT84372.1 hypothetical protein SAMN04487956_12454 [Halomonas saccharevitans]